MDDPTPLTKPHLKDGSTHQQRANRILDAAAELILRWGYDKTTIDDISRKADVAKGTIYLHWKTREDLFEALIRRESLGMREDFKRLLAEDPSSATLRGIYRNAAWSLIRRPLLKAVFLGDREILGRLIRREENVSNSMKRLAGFNIYLEFLRARNLIRSDISLQAQVYAVNAIFTGFFVVAPLFLAEQKPSDAEIADLIGDTIHRALETDREISAQELQNVSAAFKVYLEQSLNTPQTEPLPEPSATLDIESGKTHV
jgi:AcrR family transcriptional regulator